MNEPELCPACGARNDCTLADPRRAGQACWCYSVDIDPAIIEALAPELRNQACLCPVSYTHLTLPTTPYV